MRPHKKEPVDLDKEIALDIPPFDEYKRNIRATEQGTDDYDYHVFLELKMPEGDFKRVHSAYDIKGNYDLSSAFYHSFEEQDKIDAEREKNMDTLRHPTPRHFLMEDGEILYFDGVAAERTAFRKKEFYSDSAISGIYSDSFVVPSDENDESRDFAGSKLYVRDAEGKYSCALEAPSFIQKCINKDTQEELKGIYFIGGTSANPKSEELFTTSDASEKDVQYGQEILKKRKEAAKRFEEAKSAKKTAAMVAEKSRGGKE
ncbi:MAG: hypothetical protein R3Y43_05195 [Alphaproteobacteria bacterium]